MKTLYRTMRADEGGRPVTGQGPQLLGVRVHGLHQNADVFPDGEGRIHPKNPQGSGMSTTADRPDRMPRSVRPAKKYPGVCEKPGLCEDPLFSIPDSAIQHPLNPWNDHHLHVQVEPAEPMVLGEYEAALWATSASWKME